jgi:hypothetical protein
VERAQPTRSSHSMIRPLTRKPAPRWEFCEKNRLDSGTCGVARANAAPLENADRSARAGLEKYFERLVPEKTDYFTHTSEGQDDSLRACVCSGLVVDLPPLVWRASSSPRSPPGFHQVREPLPARGSEPSLSLRLRRFRCRGVPAFTSCPPRPLCRGYPGSRS